MFAVIIQDRFFLEGNSYNQLIGVFSKLYDATSFTNEFIKDNKKFKNHSIIIKELFNDDIEEIGLKQKRLFLG